MASKYTEDFVREYLSKFDYTLFSPYRTAKEHMQVRCPEGHEYPVKFEHFYYRGQRCRKCKGMAKYSNEEVNEILKKEGCELIGEYVNNRTPFTFRCSCGGIGRCTLNNFRLGNRCLECLPERMHEARRREKLKRLHEKWGE